MGDWPDEVSVGTHGHSDLLTFGLAVGGETFLTDIGSYTYTGSRPWHDYFRSARGHNVLLVDGQDQRDRKSTRLNSSHLVISYAVFCLKKKNKYAAITDEQQAR